MRPEFAPARSGAGRQRGSRVGHPLSGKKSSSRCSGEAANSGIAEHKQEKTLVGRIHSLTAHVGYQFVEVGYNVLLSVEPSCLDEPHRTAGGIKVGG